MHCTKTCAEPPQAERDLASCPALLLVLLVLVPKCHPDYVASLQHTTNQLLRTNPMSRMCLHCHVTVTYMLPDKPAASSPERLLKWLRHATWSGPLTTWSKRHRPLMAPGPCVGMWQRPAAATSSWRLGRNAVSRLTSWVWCDSSRRRRSRSRDSSRGTRKRRQSRRNKSRHACKRETT